MKQEKIIGEYEKFVLENPDNLDGYVRLIYTLVDMLIEFEGDKCKMDVYVSLLKKWYEISINKFGNCAEYLFFVGYFISLAEWLFGMKDLSIANEMKKKAAELQPNNLLYQWSYEISVHNKNEVINLAEKILLDKKTIEWLQSKGDYGSYILDAISCIYR